MKLVFPNGEHITALLGAGVNRIGSSTEAAIVLRRPGIHGIHCELHVTATGANVQIPAEGGAVTVNGKPVTDLMALRNGDLLTFGPVSAKYIAIEAVRSAPMSSEAYESKPSDPDNDSGATRVRMAVPKFMLRGVSGAVFGKVFPVSGPMAIGRAIECDIAVAAEEISRRHALVKPTSEGLAVEDLGSANGTFINGKRVQHGFLNPGDELRLDAVRFILVAPGMEFAATAAKTPVADNLGAVSAPGINKWVPIMLAAAALIMILVLLIK